MCAHEHDAEFYNFDSFYRLSYQTYEISSLDKPFKKFTSYYQRSRLTDFAYCSRILKLLHLNDFKHLPLP